MGHRADFDVVIVGASIAGCAAAALYGRRGARVALIERRPDPLAYKRACTTFMQASATPVLERLGVAPQLEAAGAVRNAMDIWTRWGWIRPRTDVHYTGLHYGYNVRRETLDPLLRAVAVATPGVELFAGVSLASLLREGQRVSGVIVRDRAGSERVVRAPLTVGADGRTSRVAKLAGVCARTQPHGRIMYFAQYRDVSLVDRSRSQMWLLEPDFAYVLPHDDGVTVLVAMPAREKLATFRADPVACLERTIAGLPDAPSIAGARRVSKVIGKVDLTNTSRPAAAPGVAFIGDAAMTSDPLWGTGCGFALQSAEWLVEYTAESIATGRLDFSLSTYRRRHRRAFALHHFLMSSFATARPPNVFERTMLAAAARDDGMARHLYHWGSRQVGPTRFLAPAALARAARVNARHHLM